MAAPHTYTQEDFTEVYDEHFSTIFNYCYRRTGNFDVARDVTAETFLKAYLNIHKFVYKGVPISSWLYRIAINEINMYYRAKKYRPSLLSELPESARSRTPELLTDERNAAEWEMEQHRQFIEVQRLLKQLPIKYQEVISLKYFEKLKTREISEILKKPEGTIKSLLSRGIQQLKRQLERNQN